MNMSFSYDFDITTYENKVDTLIDSYRECVVTWHVWSCEILTLKVFRCVQMVPIWFVGVQMGDTVMLISRPHKGLIINKHLISTL